MREIKNNYKNGYEKYIYNNKNVYEGEYKEGKIQGKGKYTYIKGDKYEGDIDENLNTTTKTKDIIFKITINSFSDER